MTPWQQSSTFKFITSVVRGRFIFELASCLCIISLIFCIVPLVVDRDDAGLVDGDGGPGGLRHVEVLTRRVAPAAVVAGQRPIWRAEVGGCDCNRRAELAPSALASVADDGVARAAHGAVVEKRRAQRRVAQPVTSVI